MRIDGHGGRILCGSRAVAAVGAWTLQRTDATPNFEATLAVSVRDTFWWQQADVEVSLKMGDRSWVWRVGQLPTAAPSITVPLSGAPVIQ